MLCDNCLVAFEQSVFALDSKFFKHFVTMLTSYITGTLAQKLVKAETIFRKLHHSLYDSRLYDFLALLCKVVFLQFEFHLRSIPK